MVNERYNYERMRALLERGVYHWRIAGEFNCSRHHVSRFAQREGLTRKPRVNFDRDRLVSLAAAGKTMSEIARTFGCDWSTMAKAAERFGVEVKRKRPWAVGKHSVRTYIVEPRPLPYTGPVVIGKALAADEVAAFRRKEMAALKRKRY